MTGKVSLKTQEKICQILAPQLDVLDNIHNDLCSSVKEATFEEEGNTKKGKLRASLRNFQECVKQMRKSFIPAKKEKKKSDGLKKLPYMKNWHTARKCVDNDIAGTDVVRNMKRGTTYYNLVKKKHAILCLPVE